MSKEAQNIYIFTYEGWKHLETGEVVQSGGMPLDEADLQALKELYIQEADEKKEE